MPSPDLLCGASDLLSSASEMMRGAAPAARRGASRAADVGPEALTQLVSLATSQVTGCSGASATLWQAGSLRSLPRATLIWPSWPG